MIGELGKIFMDFIETFVMAAAIFVVVYLFLLQPHHVQGKSMTPTFENNDYILTDKISYRFRAPERGDIVVFRAPTNPGSEYIKRVIGLPGEKVKISKGKIYIETEGQNETLVEPYISDTTNTRPGNLAHEDEYFSIPEGQYFVVGDNRGESSDSRDWGSVPRESIVGRAWFRYWPVSKVGLVKQIDYQF